MMTEPKGVWWEDFGSALADSLSFLSVHVEADAQLPLLPLRTVQKLDAREFLSVLNFEVESEAGLEGHHHRISELLPQAKPKSHWSARMANKGRRNSGTSVDDGRRPPDFGRRLRRWVDEWLDSGREADGAELPTNRSYERAKAVSAVVHKYSTRGNMHLLGTNNGLQLWFDLQAEKTLPERAGFEMELFIETVASEKLVLFLLSDLSNKLAKCRDPACGRYFILKQWNRKYRGGTLCAKCQRIRNLKSAVEATEGERDRAVETLHELAANKFKTQILKKVADWHKDTSLKKRMAQYLSEQIDRTPSLAKIYPDGVTARWIARRTNWEEIELAAKEGDSHHVSVSV